MKCGERYGKGEEKRDEKTCFVLRIKGEVGKILRREIKEIRQIQEETTRTHQCRGVGIANKEFQKVHLHTCKCTEDEMEKTCIKENILKNTHGCENNTKQTGNSFFQWQEMTTIIPRQPLISSSQSLLSPSFATTPSLSNLTCYPSLPPPGSKCRGRASLQQGGERRRGHPLAISFAG